MDSVTQITLGAAVGEATAGRQAGGKAAVWGAVLGTVADLDVLANPFLTEIEALVFHRGPTHSLLVAAMLTALVGRALGHLHNDASARRWTVLVGAVLLTHVGLDCLTSYGTRIFWPFSSTPVIGGTIFVIDPVYTIPLLTGVLPSLWWHPRSRRRRLANYVGLAVSSAYLLLTIVNKAHVNQVFAQALQGHGHSTEHVFTKPTPFNNLLWMGIAESEDGFYIGYYSLFDNPENLSFRFVEKNHELLGEAASTPVVKRLRTFSRGYFVVRQASDGPLRIIDLRFGRNDVGLTQEGTFLFRFRLVEDDTGRVVDIQQEEAPLNLSDTLLRRFAYRVLGCGAPP